MFELWKKDDYLINFNKEKANKKIISLVLNLKIISAFLSIIISWEKPYWLKLDSSINIYWCNKEKAKNLIKTKKFGEKND